MMDAFFAIKKLFQIAENIGFSQLELKVAPKLPRVLESYYQQFGKIEALNHTQDQLLAPTEIYLFQKEKYLIFYEENQCCCLWGIKVEDLGKDNPPVYISDDEQNWTQDTDHLTEFLWTMANFQAVLGGLPFNCEEFIPVDEKAMSFIRENFSLRLQKMHYFANTYFFSNYDNDVIMMSKSGENEYDLLYAAATEEHFQVLDQLLSPFI